MHRSRPVSVHHGSRHGPRSFHRQSYIGDRPERWARAPAPATRPHAACGPTARRREGTGAARAGEAAGLFVAALQHTRHAQHAPSGNTLLRGRYAGPPSSSGTRGQVAVLTPVCAARAAPCPTAALAMSIPGLRPGRRLKEHLSQSQVSLRTPQESQVSLPRACYQSTSTHSDLKVLVPARNYGGTVYDIVCRRPRQLLTVCLGLHRPNREAMRKIGGRPFDLCVLYRSFIFQSVPPQLAGRARGAPCPTSATRPAVPWRRAGRPPPPQH